MSYLISDIELAAAKLKAGEIVAIPTETVYGLAADATNELAIKKIFSTKKRPLTHPLIMHIAKDWDLKQWASHIPLYVNHLIAAFWPGPLTLIFNLSNEENVTRMITGGQDSLAIRAPSHAVLEGLLQQFNTPLVAPSANLFGKVSPTTAEHVYAQFPADDFAILDGGRSNIGIESTIIDVRSPKGYQIIRRGVINEQMIFKKTGLRPALLQDTPILKAPGQLNTHYQPEKKLLYTSELNEALKFCNQFASESSLFHFSDLPVPPACTAYRFASEVGTCAYEFYYQVRLADAANVRYIVMELPPDFAEWLAIKDRILKAGSPLIV